jgi:hypothetical protein
MGIGSSSPEAAYTGTSQGFLPIDQGTFPFCELLLNQKRGIDKINVGVQFLRMQ